MVDKVSLILFNYFMIYFAGFMGMVVGFKIMKIIGISKTMLLSLFHHFLIGLIGILIHFTILSLLRLNPSDSLFSSIIIYTSCWLLFGLYLKISKNLIWNVIIYSKVIKLVKTILNSIMKIDDFLFREFGVFQKFM